MTTVELRPKGKPTIIGRKRGDDIRLPSYEVLLDGAVIGIVERVMITRERRTPGRRYVNARWESPGWRFRTDISPRAWGGREIGTRTEGVERLLVDALPALGYSEVRELARSTMRAR